MIVGPTASGKTRLAVELAHEWNGEVVSADSMQVYRRMAIGTAKPTAEEMDGIPHHMIDVADPGEDFSAARYVEMASACVDEILARGKLPIVAGGTGLYIDSLLSGRTFAAFSRTAPCGGAGGRAGPAGWGSHAGPAGPGGSGDRRTPSPQRPQTYRPGPGGVPLHRQDHLPSMTGRPGLSPPL